MSKFLKVTGFNDITPQGYDGHRYQLSFELVEKKKDSFFPVEQYDMDIEASRTLQSVWNQSNDEMKVSSGASATSYVLALASENRLNELQTYKLNTYTAPKEPPSDPMIVSGVLLPITDQKPKQEPKSLSFLSEDISELRDQINALAKNIWNDRVLLLSQERPLLDMYKPVQTADEFRARIQSLGIIVKDVNKKVLATITSVDNSESIGEIVILQNALETVTTKEKASEICEIFKNINNLRQGYPTHGDNAKKVLEAHRFFKLTYPVSDYENAWESILGEYFRAMRCMRDELSRFWTQKVSDTQ